MRFDKYTRKARIYPSVIILIPFLIFIINCDIENLNSFFDIFLQVRLIGNATIAIALLYLLVQINRFLGKFLFEKNMFKNGLNMPSTNFLLYSNGEFSKNYKDNLRERIELDFHIKMPSESDEINNIEDTKRQIIEAVGLIRQKVKDGRLLLQHNIEYGFARNLIGGSIIGLLMSIFDLIYFFNLGDSLVGWISVILGFIFLSLLLLHKLIITSLGNLYAKRLFQEYFQA